MSLQEAIAMQPTWVGIWINWMGFAIFLLPLILLIWRASRIPAAIALLTNVAAALAVMWAFNQMGYVKLLGLPHVLLWTPLCVYLWSVLRGGTLPVWPKRLLWITFLTLIVSLVFDYVDVIRYILGERAAFVAPS